MPWLTLDLDGTLADFPFNRTVGVRLRARITHPEVQAAVRREYLRRLSSKHPAEAYDWDDINASVCAELGIPPVPKLDDLARDAVFAPELVYNDVKPALERFTAAGWRLAAATNGAARHQALAMRSLGLKVEAMVTPDTTGFVKPQRGFLEALPLAVGDEKALDGAVHVGDLLAQDVLAANRAGVRAAWVWRSMPDSVRRVPPAERPHHEAVRAEIAREFPAELERDGRVGEFYDDAEPRPDYIVADLLELADLLAA
jgi:FMN phosphatase YigB (HAD superfamily)